MPRSGAAKKNQHNQRHENGLVGPGKRITKQRSNGQLGGPSKGAVPETPSTPPIISADTYTGNNAINGMAAPAFDSRQETLAGTVRPSLRKGSSVSSVEAQSVQYGDNVRLRESEERVSRRCDAATQKIKHTNDVGALQLASAILKSCPACDTVAMLILLLQLPPIFLTLVQALFASLTFIPPTGLSMASVFTLFDVFQGSPGMPSLGTMIAVDALCLGGWFCLWNWARNFALDLAQVQIAITLGGGNAGRAGSMNNVCVTIVLFLHLVRSRSVRQFFIEHILSVKLPVNLHVHATPVLDYLPIRGDIGTTSQSPTWYRSLFAIHIITQAGIAIIRRNVASTQITGAPKSSKRVDAEVTPGVQVGHDTAPLEISTSANYHGTPEMNPPSTPVIKDSKDRAINTKRRKRQANQVRSSQPFWAALASTKVNALREIEIARPSSNSMLPTPDDLPSLYINNGAQIRIITMDSSIIRFEAVNLPLNVELDTQESGPLHPKQLFVRVNGAYWPSTSISQPPSDRPGVSLLGDISGLAPGCTYTCAFIGNNDREVAVVMVKTPDLPDKDPPPLIFSPAFQHLQRPLSPVTTIRQSIVSTEARLGETRTRATKARRGHKAALSRLDKELEALNARLKSTGDDTRQRQKLLQAERTVKQNEDATILLSDALNDLSKIPEAEVEFHATKRDAYEAQCNLLATANDTISSAKESASSEVTSLNEEWKAVVRQHERLITRQTRLDEQLERITQANLQGLNEMERKAAETLARERDRSRLEAEYSNQFSIFQRELANVSMRTQQAKQDSQAIESRLLIQQHSSSTSAGVALTPEGNLPLSFSSGQRNPLSFGQATSSSQPLTASVPRSPDPPNAHLFSNYNSPVAFHSSDGPKRGNERGRSASNRSGGAYSNYSAEDADLIPTMSDLPAIGPIERRKDSAQINQK